MQNSAEYPLAAIIHCISILHSTGPRPDWDPDIVATLDDDYDHCDSLEDDFVGVANAADQDEPHPSHQ